MPYLETVTDLGPESLSRFDAIIDVRSPAEFADDHLPGAMSLPVLSNDERAVVGTIYKQESPFRANRIGGAIVARNIAHHLDTALAWLAPTHLLLAGRHAVQRHGDDPVVGGLAGWPCEGRLQDLAAGGRWRARAG